MQSWFSLDGSDLVVLGFVLPLIVLVVPAIAQKSLSCEAVFDQFDLLDRLKQVLCNTELDCALCIIKLTMPAYDDELDMSSTSLAL
jgi:hypothetical protein